MSTAVLPGTNEVAAPPDRGETIIAPRVIEKIAGRAASEIDGVSGGEGGSGGSGLFPWSLGGDGSATAQIDLSGGTVRVDLSMSVEYPRPVAAVTNAVRAQVIRRLAELCGMEATRVDISVLALVGPELRARRRVE